MENLDSDFVGQGDGVLDALGKSYLLATAKWARFLSIIGFVFIAIIVVIAFLAGTIFNSMSALSSQLGQMGNMGAVFTVLYLCFAAFYFFPTWYLFKFATLAINALEHNSDSLTTAFSNLKSCFKFWGVLCIIMLGFYALAAVIALIGFSFR